MTIKSIRTGWTGISALAGNDQWFSDFESIASVVVGSDGTADLTFSSIPSTYQHLQIRIFAREATGGDTSAGDQIKIQFNGDTGSNYNLHRLWGSGSGTPSADGYANQSNALANGVAGSGTTAGIFSAGVVDILDYANTNKNKTVRSLMGADLNGSGSIWMTSSAWRNNTNAINSIKLISTHTFAQNSHFALYGIRG